MIEKVLLGLAGAGCPGFKVREVVGERAVALFHCSEHVLGLGDSVLWLEFRLEEAEEFSPVVGAYDATLFVGNREDVFAVGDLFQVRACPDGSVAGHERKCRSNHFTSVVPCVTVIVRDDVAVLVPFREGSFVVLYPYHEGAAEKAGLFRAFAFKGLRLLDDVDGASVTGDGTSGASECGDGLGEVVDRVCESPDRSDHLVNLLICGERPLFLRLCLCLGCRGRVGALDARHCERV